MPTYEYACESCGHSLEVFQRMVEEPLTECPECGESTLKRKIGIGAGIIFKGGGFYETDFKDKKRSNSSDKPPKKKEDSAKNTDSGSKKTAKTTTSTAKNGSKKE